MRHIIILFILLTGCGALDTARYTHTSTDSATELRIDVRALRDAGWSDTEINRAIEVLSR